MSRALVFLSCLLLLDVGCVGYHQRQADGLDSADPRVAPPSPEATAILRRLHLAAANGDVPTDGPYNSARLAYLEGELRGVGARLGADGRILDRNGREVTIWQESGGYGCQVSEERLQHDRDEEQVKLRELRAHYTVIVLPYFGPGAC